VPGERGEGAGAEVAVEEPDREVGGDAVHQHLYADVVAVGSEEVRELVDPAARMTGVASMNESRASSWSRPLRSPATIVTPDRLMPANRARTCAEPLRPLRAAEVCRGGDSAGSAVSVAEITQRRSSREMVASALSCTPLYFRICLGQRS